MKSLPIIRLAYKSGPAIKRAFFFIDARLDEVRRVDNPLFNFQIEDVYDYLTGKARKIVLSEYRRVNKLPEYHNTGLYFEPIKF